MSRVLAVLALAGLAALAACGADGPPEPVPGGIRGVSAATTIGRSGSF